MNITFLGASKEVGRSGILVDIGTEKFVLDYGTKVDGKPARYPKKVDVKLDGILLSHAHLDHIGAVPILYKQGQKCYNYGLQITKAFTRMLLKDSLKIARAEGFDPPFMERDISATLKHFKAVEYNKEFNIGNTKITFIDAGHIPGSAMIKLEANGQTLLYTGDFNISSTRLLKGLDLEEIENIDILIIESTYAKKEHADRRKEEMKFIDCIKSTLANDGIAIVASFAVARTQELLLILDHYDIKCPIYIDGMGQKTTEIIDDYPHLQRDYNEVEKAINRLNVKFVEHASNRKKIIKKPCIILTTSGMLSGGPFVWYIKKLYNKPECSVLLTGYQVSQTEGDILIQTGRYIHDNLNLDVKMSINKFDFSAHASHSQMIRLIKRINPRRIFCIHGDNTEKFAEELRQQGFVAEAAELRNYKI